jgi:NAD(P)-dependent dehydrogenase (short-subunit alcohol dehydrogenase family)
MKKTIMITGASSGFGRETAQLFHQKGWNVIATMRSPEKETALSHLDNVQLLRLDVTDKKTIERAVKEGLDRFGRIDVLVNNAGFGTLGALEVAPEELIRRQFEVNFFGLVAVTQAVLPAMRQQRAGTVINVSSVGGRLTFPFCSLYHATKFAVEGMTESLQYELNPLGIRLKIVEPGGYKTEFAGRSMGYFGAGGLEDYQAAFDGFAAKVTDWPMSENVREVAEVIYEAATDGTEKLRYPAGQEAAHMLQARQQMDDVDFKKMMAAQLGVADTVTL